MSRPKVWLLKDTTFFARYFTNKWTVTFDANGGTGSMDPVSQDEGIYTLPASTFTPPSHYHFVGWSYKSDGEVIPAAFINLESDVTLYAIYSINTFKVSFWANGGVGTKDPIMVPYGNYTLPPVPFNNPGKKNVGWAYTPDGKYIEQKDIYVTQDINLYAIYQSIYISFDGNGGTGSMATVELQTKEYTLPECKFGPPSSTKEFIGWAYSGSGEIITTPTITPDKDITLYAIWDDIFVITLLLEDESGRTLTVVRRHSTGYDYTLPTKCPLVPKEGYIWTGWSYTPNGDLITDKKITITKDITIYGVCDCIVTLDPNGSKSTKEMIRVKKGVTYTLPVTTEFEPPMLRFFDGWSYYPKGLQIPDETIVISKAVTLYARWISNYDGWVQILNYNDPIKIDSIREVYAKQSSTTAYKLSEDKLAFWNSIEIYAYETSPLELISVEKLPQYADSSKIYFLIPDSTYWHFEYDVLDIRGGSPLREDEYAWAEQTLSSADQPVISNSTHEVYFNTHENKTFFYDYLKESWVPQNQEVYGLKESAEIDSLAMEEVKKSPSVDTDFYKITTVIEGFKYWCWGRLVKKEFFLPDPPRINELTYYSLDTQNHVFVASRPIYFEGAVKTGVFDTKIIYGSFDGPFIRAGIAHQIAEVTILDDIVPVEFSHYFDQLQVCKRYNGMEHIKLDYCTISESVFAINYAVTEINGTEQWNTSRLERMGAMFHDCQSLKSLDLSKWDTKNNTGLMLFFYGCRSLEHVYVGPNWSTEKVTDNGDRMFRNCSKLPNWDGTQTVSKAHYGPGGYLEYKEPED